MSQDRTACARQKKHLTRLKEVGITRYSTLVHDDNLDAYESFRLAFQKPEFSGTLGEVAAILSAQITNVSQVSQLSPFRYPGGKTWLVPEIKKWLLRLPSRPKFFIEPFAGGGIVSLTVAAERLADRVVMVELDEDVAAVWETIFETPEWLCDRILQFDLTRENVIEVLQTYPESTAARAFRTILQNRTQHGGVLAPGASFMRTGENGRGIASRWYPETLARRIRAIAMLAHRITFIHGDAFSVIAEYAKEPRATFYVDPPYTAGGKKAGKRLYKHSEIDHKKLFRSMSSVSGSFLMSYDDAEEVRVLATQLKFGIDAVPMKNTHHAVMNELLISRNPLRMVKPTSNLALKLVQ